MDAYVSFVFWMDVPYLQSGDNGSAGVCEGFLSWNNLTGISNNLTGISVWSKLALFQSEPIAATVPDEESSSSFPCKLPSDAGIVPSD